jgi:rhamnogalacturonyl hydrolase YesR
MKIKIITLLCFAVAAYGQVSDTGPLKVAKRIADRIISETSFELTEVEQKSILDLQVIDFRKVFKNKSTGTAYAFAGIEVKKDEKLSFGVSYSSPFKLWINDKLVFENRNNVEFRFQEIAYSIFSFQDTIFLKLSKGVNKIIFQSDVSENSLIYFREMIEPEKKSNTEFVSPFSSFKQYTWPWLYIESNNSGNLNENSENYQNTLLPYIDSLFRGSITDRYSYIFPEPVLLKKLVVKSNSTFKKDSYADWNYPNGAMMMVLLNLSEVAHEHHYKEFVQKFCNFLFENFNLFKKQYFDDHDIRGSYHRIFRKSMLDDAGAPALPFIDLDIKDYRKDYDSLINEMEEFILKKQYRLNDGTFCRPEPEVFTVWADDLFMSSIFLLRVGILKKDNGVFDEIANQMLNFHKYLYDDKYKLYKHGWFSKTNQKSNVFWGRANGWIIWATSEALMYLPKNHKSYKEIESNFKNHLEGIINLQDANGMWHQILDDKTSFEETSSTSMFIIGLSRAIINRIISKKYSTNVLSAWKALQKNIDENGVVKNICCGTGIGNTNDFYKNRERYDNDPRGLGAVIQSIIEIQQLKEFLRMKN